MFDFWNRTVCLPACTWRFGVMHVIVLAAPLFFARPLAAQDVIEFTSGAKIKGTVSKIDKAEKRVTFESKIGVRTTTRTYNYRQIHAVTYRGKRYVLTPKTSRPTVSSGTGKPDQDNRTSRQEVERLIQSVGSTPPDWLNSTRLNYPRTLDLSWPPAKSSQWNTQKNVGHYLWSVINENPSRWREGVKLMYHVVSISDSNPGARNQASLELGEQFHNLFQDYARAAHWYRQAGVDKNPPRGNPEAPIHMAECYWKLGNKDMAMELINKVPRLLSIKLLADMGEFDKAVRLAEASIKTRDPWTVGNACLYAGDACRTSGDFQRALAYYRKTLAIAASGRLGQRVQRIQNRAKASITAIELFELTDLNRVADGAYRSSSLGYEGPVHVEVVVRSNRIESVKVTQHREKQFYSALTDTPRKIISKQGVKGVDTTSSATITSEAIINATAKALAGK